MVGKGDHCRGIEQLAIWVSSFILAKPLDMQISLKQTRYEEQMRRIQTELDQITVTSQQSKTSSTPASLPLQDIEIQAFNNTVSEEFLLVHGAEAFMFA